MALLLNFFQWMRELLGTEMILWKLLRKTNRLMQFLLLLYRIGTSMDGQWTKL